ncbi:hypothetical protein [Rhizobium sp. CF142]|nr:hypothetical protein [Rhizobium sp. CF142]
MIAPGANVRVYLACGVTDMRKGIQSWAVPRKTARKRIERWLD